MNICCHDRHQYFLLNCDLALSFHMVQQHKILLWTGRISGLIVTLFFLAFLIGEGLPDINNDNADELLYLLPFALPAFAGYILSWFRPIQGGWLLIIGGLLLVGYFIYFDDLRMVFVFGISTILVGACFLAAVNRELI